MSWDERKEELRNRKGEIRVERQGREITGERKGNE